MSQVAAAGARLDVLLVTSRYPWPARRGDQLRAAQFLRLLTPEHRVTLLVPRPAGKAAAAPAEGGAEILTYEPGALPARVAGLAAAALRGLPLQGGLFASPDLRRRLRQLLAARRFDVAILQLVRLAGVRGELAAMPVVVDLIDDLALNFRRRAPLDRPWLAPLLRLEARRLGRAQCRLAEAAAAAILVCERDRASVAATLSRAAAQRTRVVGLAGLAAERPPLEVPAPPGRLVFTGNLGYFVNADAITWWLRQVWPAVAARHPGVELVVAGDRPASAVRRAVAAAPAAGGRRPRLVAAVPDLGPWLAGATVALAPLRCGAGVPVKILEAWAAGTPVIASPWAAAGTTAVPGEDLQLAESAGEWQAAIDRLLNDPDERARLAAGGRRRLHADYSEEAVRRQLTQVVREAAARTVPDQN